MTRPPSKRRDERPGEPAAVGERAGDGDDDEDPGVTEEDPGLRSMRAVWLSMRDEEPPAAGLTALLAAARDKAEAMRPKPSWWQRALAQLRRPPVLALATVVVLIGGALAIINGRSLEAEQARTSTPRTDMAAGQSPEGQSVALGPSSDDGERRAGEGDKVRQPEPATGVPALAQSAPAAPEPTGASPPREAPPARRRPRPSTAVDRPNDLGDEEPARRSRGAGGAAAPPAAPAPMPPPPPAAVPDSRRMEADQLADRSDDAAGRGLAGARDEAAPRATDRAQRPGAPLEEQAAVAAQAQTADARTKQGAAVTQLAKQCENAAARGDCAAVRTMVQRINKLDPGYYKQQRARSLAITRCLRPTLPETQTQQ